MHGCTHLKLVVGLAALWLAAGLPEAAEAQVTLASVDQDHVSVQINGKPFSDFFFGRAYAKPFLAPLRSASGLVVTRRFPMEEVEGESHDHPHHKGLWIGYGDVNGINFWEVEPESKPSKENPAEKGTIRLVNLGELKSGNKSGSLRATFDWLNPKGRPILTEQREMVFYADDQIRRIDVDATLTAGVAVTFADTKEGFFAIRVADSMIGKNGGMITNSEGAHTEKDVWGKRADWVDYIGSVDGQKLGILILDNPQNPNHPPRWHARDYGLFAANPFGEKAFDPHTTAKGGLQLARGSSLRFRYRVIVHSGDAAKKDIAHWYADYRKSAK